MSGQTLCYFTPPWNLRSLTKPPPLSKASDLRLSYSAITCPTSVPRTPIFGGDLACPVDLARLYWGIQVAALHCRLSVGWNEVSCSSPWSFSYFFGVLWTSVKGSSESDLTPHLSIDLLQTLMGRQIFDFVVLFSREAVCCRRFASWSTNYAGFHT